MHLSQQTSLPKKLKIQKKRHLKHPSVHLFRLIRLKIPVRKATNRIAITAGSIFGKIIRAATVIVKRARTTVAKPKLLASILISRDSRQCEYFRRIQLYLLVELNLSEAPNRRSMSLLMSLSPALKAQKNMISALYQIRLENKKNNFNKLLTLLLRKKKSQFLKYSHNALSRTGYFNFLFRHQELYKIHLRIEQKN